MVKEAQGTTDLVFPTDLDVGDVYIGITNNFPYEFMDDGRWRNVNLAALIGFSNPVDPNLPLAASRFLPIATGELSDRSQDLTLYPKETIGGQLARMTEFTATDDLPDDSQGELFLQYDNIDRVYRIIDWNDESIPFWSTIVDKGITYGDWELSAAANNVPSFNNDYKVGTWWDIHDLVYDTDFKSLVKIRFRWKANKGLPNSSETHSWSFTTWADDNLGLIGQHNYLDGTSQPDVILSVEGNEDFPSSAVFASTKEITTPWTFLTPDCRYLWFQNNFHAGQRTGGWVLEIIDPEYPGLIASRNLSGLSISEDEDKVYTSQDLINEIRQYDLSTARQINTGLEIYSETDFHDPDNFSPPDLVTPQGLHLTEDGRILYVADETDGKVKQYVLRTEEDLSTMFEYDPFNSWNYNDKNKEFSTVANPRDCQVSIDGSNLYTLEDDNVMRRYSITNRDVSTAVFEDSFSLASVTTLAKSFCLSPTEKSLIIAESGSIQEIFLSAAPSLNVPLIRTAPLSFDIDEPTGIRVSRDGERIYISDKSTSDVDSFQQIKQFDQ